MNLDTFISESIKSIIKGTKDVQEYARDNGGRINPIRHRIDITEAVYFGSEEHGRPLTMIDFDVAVTVASKSDSGVEGGIRVLSLNIGGKKSDSDINEIVSRIKFKIGIVLPHELS